MKNCKLNKPFLTTVSVCIIFAVSAGIIFGFYTDHHAAMNTFTAGQVKINLEEPEYNQSENVNARKDIAPRQKIVKDPHITNAGTSDCYVFVEICIPMPCDAGITGVDSEGRKVDMAMRDLFTFSVNPGWIPVEEMKDVTCGTGHHYIYAYGTGTASEGTMTVLHHNETTENLLSNDSLEYFNALEGTFPEDYVHNIPVKAYAVQTTDINGTDGQGKTAPADVWSVVKAQKGSD